MQEQVPTARTVLAWMGKVILAGCLSLAVLELLFLPYAKRPGTPQIFETGSRSFINAANRFYAQMSEGFSWGRTDQNGFLNTTPIPAQIDLLLMGSSHIEGMNVMADETVAAALNRTLESTSYSIGASGQQLDLLAVTLAPAIREFAPKKAVLAEALSLEFTDAQLEDAIHSDDTYSTDPEPWYMQIYRELSYARVLRRQYTSAKAWASPPNSGDTPAENAPTDGALLRQMLAKMQSTAAEHGLPLVIFHHPHLVLDSAGAARVDTDPDSIARFRQACEDSGITFLDMSPRFLAEYQERHILPHGYINTKVGEGHLNREGHRMIAEELAALLLREGIAV